MQDWRVFPRCAGFVTARRLVCVAAALGIGGCSGGDDKWVKGRPPVYKATGVVRYKGAPLEGALVLYHPEVGDAAAQGTTNAEGKYVLTTYNDNDGAAAGKYKVTISKAEYERKPTARDTPGDRSFMLVPKPLLAAKYSQQKSTELSAEVVAKGDNNKDFDLQE